MRGMNGLNRLVTCAGLLAAISPSHAGSVCSGCSTGIGCDEFTWQGGGGCFNPSGNYGSGGAWSGFLPPPGSVDVATFDLPCTYTVSFSSNHTLCRAFVLDGDVTFDLNGNTWAVSGGSSPADPTFRVGQDSSSAIMRVIDGAVTTVNMEVGWALSSFSLDGNGNLHVGASGKIDASGTLSVGGGSASANVSGSLGALEVSSTGEVTAGSIIVGNRNAGTLVVDGTLAVLDSDNDISISTKDHAAAGVLDLRNGGEATAAGAIRLRRNSSTVLGVGVLDAPLVKNGDGGKIQVASASTSGSTGFLDVSGDYEQTTEFMDSTAGTLEIDIKGAAAGTGYDQLRVAGDAALAGTLKLSRDGSYNPCAGDRFDVLTANARTGTFGTVTIGTGSGFSDCRSWRIVYCSDRVTALVDTIAGDVDFDGDVDGDDTNLVSANFSATGCIPDGDADFNGVVNFADLNIVLNNQNNTCSLSSCP